MKSGHFRPMKNRQTKPVLTTESQSSAGDQTTGAEYTLTVDGRFSGYFQIEETEEGGRPIAYDMIFVP